MAAITTLPLTHTAHADSVSPPITALTFSPEGNRIVAGSQAGLTVRDAASGDVLKSIGVDMDNVHDVKFSPDAETLIVAGGNPAETGAVEVLQWPTLRRKQKLLIHDDVIYSVDYSPDGSHWVAASGDEVCSVFKIGSLKPTTRFTQHSRGVMAAAFLPDGETVVSGSRDETLRVWKASSGQSLRTLHNHSREVLALAVKPTAEGLPMIASGSADLSVRFWQPTIGRMVRFARLANEPLCMAWCNDDKLIAGCRDGTARLIDAQAVKIERAFPLASSWLYAVAVRPSNDQQIVFGSSDGQVIQLAI